MGGVAGPLDFGDNPESLAFPFFDLTPRDLGYDLDFDSGLSI